MAFLETLWAAIAVLGLAGPAPAPEPVLVANDTPRLKSSKIKAVDLAETLRDTSINKLRIVSDDMPDEPFDLSPLAGADHILHLSIYREGKVDLTPILWMKGLRELHLSIDAAREIVLRCGESSITLTRAGKIILKGKYVSSHSAGVNRIKGGSIQIN